jgi:PKD repeat protein
LKPLYSRNKNLSITKRDLDKKGLTSVQATMVEPNTQGLGLLGIGLLKPLPDNAILYSATTNSKGNPVVSSNSVQTYSLFFAQYENAYIPAGDEKLYSFVVVKTLNPISASDCALQLGMKQNNVIGLTIDQYNTGEFKHPFYTTMENEPLYFKYIDVPAIIQTVPGRLDNVPVGYPNFPLTPNKISSQQGMLPQPPYPDFITSGGQTGATSISLGGTVSFIDTSLRIPTTVQPTSWIWSFGPGTGACAGSTGLTAQNPTVYFGLTGSYTVILTASNANGSNSITKNNFVIVS